MKMMLSILAATFIFSGVFSKALASDGHDAAHNAAHEAAMNAHNTAHEEATKAHNTSHDEAVKAHNAAHEAAHDDHGGGHHKEIGFKQPTADLTKSQRPGKVTLAEPKAFAKLKGGIVTLTWKAVEGAESYDVQVATDPRFKWFISNAHFVKGESFQTPALEAGTYFWRVAAKKPGNMPGYTTSFFTSSSFDVE